MQTKIFRTQLPGSRDRRGSVSEPASMRRISIIIVNWNGAALLPDCLESLEQQTFTDFEVILVDNGSSDASVEYVQSLHPWVNIVRLPENRGFAAGNNIGLSHACGEYIITLNNDTMAEPGWLAELVAVTDAYPDAGMVASRICNFYDRDMIDSLGMSICRDGMSRGAYRLHKFSALSLEKGTQILFPSACAGLYRRSMIEQTGFFDEDFFAFCEDTDLGLRGRLAGWGALLARDAVVWHKYSQTTGTFSPLKLYLVERNHFWAALKCFPAGMLLALPFWTIVRYLVQLQLVAGARGVGAEFRTVSSADLIKAVLRGIVDMMRGIPAVLRKRRKIAATRRLSSGEMRKLLQRHELSFRELLDAG